MKKLLFATSNKHKVIEAKDILGRYKIDVEQLDIKYPEDKEKSVREIAFGVSGMLSAKINKTVIVEDTGIFFNAYKGFPGAVAKFVIQTIGYDGVFRLLKGKSNKARFVSAVGYCEPGKKPKVFMGYMDGRIIDEVRCQDRDVLPYERIFVPDGYSATIAELGFRVKNLISHRAMAFNKLGEFLVKK